MIDKDKNAAANEMLMLGVGILIIGLILAIYSISTYVEMKNLREKIDFELIDANTKLTSSDKYYEYLSISEFLMKKLNQNKNIPVKNTACVYLNYAHENAILMYNLTSRKLNQDIAKRSNSAVNIRTLYNMYDNYKGCRQTAELKKELEKYIAEIENGSNDKSDTDERMYNFIHGDSVNEQFSDTETYVPEAVLPSDEMTEEQRKQLEQDMNNVRQWQSDSAEQQPQERPHVVVPAENVQN